MESPIIEDRFICRPFYKENYKDMELDDWSPPDADLTQKMVTQIEHYLSDENLAKDAFLLKHVKRNKMGYVNIKLLTSFKKMKPLTKDWRVTAYALNYSSKLEVNKEGNKVRRKDPVPESLLVQVPSRLLFMWNISAELTSSGNGGDEDVPAPQRSTMETAITLLEPFGSICTVRVFRPGKELPQEVQRFANRYPELCSQESVLVEYEDLEGASRAYHQLSQSEDFVRVVLIGMTSKKKAGHKLGGCVEDRGVGKGVSIANRCLEQLQSRGEDSSAWSSSGESEMASPMHMPRFSSGQVCRSPWDSPRSSPYHSPRVLRAPLPTLPRVSPLLASEMWRSPDTSPDLSRRNYENPADSSSLWFQRRKLAAVQTSSLDDSSSSKQGRLGIKRVLMGDSLPPGVIRFPYGPDGTRGFPSSFVGRTLQYSLKT
ncbi:la-related protein 6-like [Oncorhynchus masou masou]|uniref:la-related protein 6-like n=1 Tax=Oncorhynchus masou masou TaxID=90313 RepID=UPI0031843D2C